MKPWGLRYSRAEVNYENTYSDPIYRVANGHSDRIRFGILFRSRPDRCPTPGRSIQLLACTRDLSPDSLGIGPGQVPFFSQVQH